MALPGDSDIRASKFVPRANFMRMYGFVQSHGMRFNLETAIGREKRSIAVSRSSSHSELSDV